MRRLFLCLLASWVAVAVSDSAYCHGPKAPEYSYGFRWEVDPVVSHAFGHGYLHGPGWDLSAPGWFSMSREDWEKLKKVRGDFQKETEEVRRQLVVKQMELTTLWAQPKLEPSKIEKLLDEVVHLQAELGKKRGQHLIRCRQQFGGEQWTCPGIWVGTKVLE